MEFHHTVTALFLPCSMSSESTSYSSNCYRTQFYASSDQHSLDALQQCLTPSMSLPCDVGHQTLASKKLMTTGPFWSYRGCVPQVSTFCSVLHNTDSVLPEALSTMVTPLPSTRCASLLRVLPSPQSNSMGSYSRVTHRPLSRLYPKSFRHDIPCLMRALLTSFSSCTRPIKAHSCSLFEVYSYCKGLRSVSNMVPNSSCAISFWSLPLSKRGPCWPSNRSSPPS